MATLASLSTAESKAAEFVAGAADATHVVATPPPGVPKMTHNCMQGVVTVIRSWTSDETNCICRIVAYVATIFLSLLATATVAGIPFVWLAYQEHGVQKAEAHYMKYPVKDESAVTDEEYNELSAELEKTQKALTDAESALTIEKSAVMDVRAQLEKAKASSGAPVAEVESLRAELEAARKMQSELEGHVTSLSSEKATLVGQIKSAEAQVASLKTSSGSIQAQLTKAQNDYTKLHSDLVNAQTQYGVAQGTIESLRGQITTFEALNKGSADVLKAATEPLQQQIATLTKTNSTHNAEIGKLKGELAVANSKVTNLEAELTNVRGLESTAQARINELNEQLLKTNQALAASQQDAQKAQAEVTKLKNEASKETIKFMSMQAKLESTENELGALKGVNEKSKEQLNILQTRNKQLEAEIPAIQQKLENAIKTAAANADAQKNVVKLTQEKQALEARLASAKTQKDIDDAVAAAKAGLKTQAEFDAALKAAMADMARELASTKLLLESAEVRASGKVTGLSEQNTKLEGKVKELQLEITKLQNQKRDEVERRETAEAEVSKLRSADLRKQQEAVNTAVLGNPANRPVAPAKVAAPAKVTVVAPKPEQKGENPKA